MNQKQQPDLQRMLGDKNALRQLAGNRNAQQLAAMLSQGQDQASLRQIARKAASGDTAQLAALVSSIARDPQAAQLLQRLQEDLQR